MKQATFIFTCDYDPKEVLNTFNKKGVQIAGDLQSLFNTHLNDLAKVILPIPYWLFSKVELHVSDSGEPSLKFITSPLKYTVYKNEYILLTPGIKNKLPVLVPVEMHHPKYRIEVNDWNN